MVQTSVLFRNLSYYHRIDHMAGGVSPSDIRTFQDALRKFPPRTDKDGVAPEVKDVVCRDCEAVFSSTYDFP